MDRAKRKIEAAKGYLMLDLPNQALAELRCVENPGEHGFELHLVRGEALRCLEQHHAAIAAFEAALAHEPTSLDSLMGLAWCCKRTGQLPRSIDALLEAYRSHADEPIVPYNLSCYYALARDKKSALKWLGKALQMRRDLLRLIPDETDFNSLRDDPEFLDLLKSHNPDAED